MAKLNTKTKAEPIFTAEGARAVRCTNGQQLARMLNSCMLWEDNFYMDGKEIAKLIAEQVAKVTPEQAKLMAIKARTEQKLRHAPLLVAREMARLKDHKALVADTLYEIIQRPDELAEFLKIYWSVIETSMVKPAFFGYSRFKMTPKVTVSTKKQPIANQVKLGLARAFTKFDEYALAKYNSDGDIKLRDVLFLVHAKPQSAAQAALWKKLVDGTLESPDTWEVNLSAGADKKATFTRLLEENKLGALALLRNLRNMTEAKVDDNLIREGILNMNTERVLPFRFITAAKYAPKFEDVLEKAMFKCVAGLEKLPGKTVLVVDISGSMYGGGNVSSKSELTRVDAAAALAMLIREISEEPVIYCTAGNDSTRRHATALVPPRRGFGLASVITKAEMRNKLGGGGIFLAQVMDFLRKEEKTADRVIVITDEQDCDTDRARSLKTQGIGEKNYIINVSTERNGVGYRNGWSHIDGWSEAIISYIMAEEALEEDEDELN